MKRPFGVVHYSLWFVLAFAGCERPSEEASVDVAEDPNAPIPDASLDAASPLEPFPDADVEPGVLDSIYPFEIGYTWTKRSVSEDPYYSCESYTETVIEEVTLGGRTGLRVQVEGCSGDPSYFVAPNADGSMGVYDEANAVWRTMPAPEDGAMHLSSAGNIGTWRYVGTVTVAAGAIPDCFLLEDRLASVPEYSDDSTYCRGVGYVKQERVTPQTTLTRELLSYDFD